MVLIMSGNSASWAQMPRLAVVGIDVQAVELKSHNITELVRIQLTTFNKYQQLDRYEVSEVLRANNLDAATCMSLSCLKNVGELLKVDKVLTGSLDQMGEVLFIRLRLVNVKSGAIEKETLKEFLMLPEYINSMITMSLNSLFDLPNDKLLERSLTSKNNYENAVNNPNYNTLKLSGPRMGYAFFAGEAARTLKKAKIEGGYDAVPALFQFGYQFEQQYLSEGKYQALFEFIPMIVGLDQQMFIPSFTFMNGLRNNENGFEFAIGPNFSLVKEALYFVGKDGAMIYRDDFYKESRNEAEYERIHKLDSRGVVRFRSSIVIGVGTSLRSGKMNIPINAFVVPSKDNFRYGLSFGFNARG